MMPDMNGYEVLGHVKANASLSDVPIIMISALDEIGQRHPLHRARRRRLPEQAVQSGPVARARRGTAGKEAPARRGAQESRAPGGRNGRRARAAARHAAPPVSALFARRSRWQCTPSCSRRAKSAAIFTTVFTPAIIPFAFWSAMCPAKVLLRRCSWRARAAWCGCTVELWRQWRTRRGAAGATGGSGQPRTLPEQRRADVRYFVPRACSIPAPAYLSFINAGHPAPHLLAQRRRRRADRRKARVCRSAFASMRNMKAGHFALQPGDAMFVCSDGVFEALNENGDLFSIERLNRELSSAGGADPVEIVRLIQECRRHIYRHGAKGRRRHRTSITLAAGRAKCRKGRSMTRSVDLMIRNDLSEIAIVRDALDQLGSELRSAGARTDAVAGGSR